MIHYIDRDTVAVGFEVHQAQEIELYRPQLAAGVGMPGVEAAA